jgi:KipI family sensor histidine kinase inhibitor
LSPELREVGERGLLIELGSVGEVAAAFRHYALARHHVGLEEVVPGHTTLLLIGRERRPEIEPISDVADTREEEPAPALEIPVTYDGPDLAMVGGASGMSPEEVARRHEAARYDVAFLGFAPGQAYLVGGDPALAAPRRAEPRTRVPAGSVAIAGEYTTVYPSSTPGGWQLLGRTETKLFDPSCDPPALLSPGATVTFTSTRR